jgi:hypothetical protein
LAELSHKIYDSALLFHFKHGDYDFLDMIQYLRSLQTRDNSALANTPHVNEGPSLIILFWVLAGVTTVVVALRIFAKARIGHLKVDDATMMIAWVG